MTPHLFPDPPKLPKTFAGLKVLTENPAQCSDCGKRVYSVLIELPDGLREWRAAEMLGIGWIGHTCPSGSTRIAA